MNDDQLTLDGYQQLAAQTDTEVESSSPLIPLLGLIGEVGELGSEFKRQERPDGVSYKGFDEAVATELGDVLWYVATLARRTGLKLSDVARMNLDKTTGRWLYPESPRERFDTDFPPDQRLPSKFEVLFQRKDDQMIVSISGEQLGDPIDDNSYNADHYRFHDVFHLSYAAVLGWSPILRSLLDRKRKCRPEVDRVEDGARAGVTEEAVSALVFKMARTYDYFEGQNRVDDRILASVATVVSGLEVADRTQAEWERAILTGFEVWRELREKGEGTVVVDLDSKSLNFHV